MECWSLVNILLNQYDMFTPIKLAEQWSNLYFETISGNIGRIQLAQS